MKGGEGMEKKHVLQFLEFRKQFTKREWFELNRLVKEQLLKKADQLTLDDSDIQIIVEQAKDII